MQRWAIVLLGLALAAPAAAAVLPAGTKLYIAPMEWNLDRFVTTEIQNQGLSVHLVGRPEDADYVMTARYQTLGTRQMSPGHYIQVTIVASSGGNQVWKADASDYATFFGRLRSHGPGRAAASIVKKLRAAE